MKRFLIPLLLLAAVPCWAGTRDLKEDTAVTIVVGPFVDDTGAAVTAPTIASIDITAYKNDGTAVGITPAASGSSNDMVHVDDGYYSLEVTTTDTSTPGYLRLTFQISGSLIFHEDFNILPANIYDSKYSTDKLDVNVVEAAGTAWGSGAITAGSIATGAIDSTALAANAIATGTIQDNAITAAAIAADAIGSSEMAADAIGASELATDAIGSAEVAASALAAGTEITGLLTTGDITTGVWNAAAASYGGAGTYGQAVEDILDDTGTSGVQIPAGEIVAATFGSGAIDATAIAANAIGSSEIATGAIDSTALAANAIAIGTIEDNAITAGAIAADAIGSSELAADAIDAASTSADFLTEINGEVLDVLNVDTFAEPGQGTPAATTSLAAKINYLYKFARNKKDASSSEVKYYNDDASTVDHKATVNTSGGTTTVGETATGP